MTDPKDELGARFDERRPDHNQEPDADVDETDNMNDPVNTPDTESASDTSQSDNSNNPNNTNNMQNASSTEDTQKRPGPDRDDTATRHRKQVPMYLPDEKAAQLNELYERLDGRSKLAGEGGIEKHADFMEALVDIAVDHEDKLAERIGINYQ